MTTNHPEPTLRELIEARRSILFARLTLAAARNEARQLLDFGGDNGLLMAELERTIVERVEADLASPAKPDNTLAGPPSWLQMEDSSKRPRPELSE